LKTEEKEGGCVLKQLVIFSIYMSPVATGLFLIN